MPKALACLNEGNGLELRKMTGHYGAGKRVFYRLSDLGVDSVGRIWSRTHHRESGREEKRPLLLKRTVDDIQLIFVERTGFGLTGQ